MISLIIGLGNPSERYLGTRHNLGFEVLNGVRCELGFPSRVVRETYEWSEGEYDERMIALAWPRTYMNRSGVAVAALLQHYDLRPAQMLVVSDDFNLPLGRLRIRKSGSDGGHNGIGSIIEELATEDFPRLRVGIGPIPDNVDRADFVLSKFEKEERESIEKSLVTAVQAVAYTISHRLETAMNQFNVNPV